MAAKQETGQSENDEPPRLTMDTIREITYNLNWCREAASRIPKGINPVSNSAFQEHETAEWWFMRSLKPAIDGLLHYAAIGLASETSLEQNPPNSAEGEENA